jgi:cytidylate kinase
MYRAVTLEALREGLIQPDGTDASTNEEALAALAASLALVLGDRVLVAGEDVSAAIRTPEVDRAVSAVAACPKVRAELVRRQRAWVVEHGGGVVEGRDIGTVVLPDATVKVFLVADPAVRAARRAGQLGTTPAAVAGAMGERDLQDSRRRASPLVPAEGAHLLDTTERSVEDLVAEISGWL